MEDGTSGAVAQAQEERQVFIRPTRRNALEVAAWVVGLPYLVVVMMWLSGTMPLSSPASQVFLWSPVLSVPFSLLLAVQRVIVEGTTVRFMGMQTLFRWRSFDGSEVSAVRWWRSGDTGRTLQISLVAAPHRRWKALSFSSIASHMKYYRGIDLPLFVACVRAVARAQPALVVQGLPDDYAGAMPAPARQSARRADADAVQAGPSSVGQERKRRNNKRGKR